jgi:transcriptional regulator with XRE-family HTH domain
LVARRSLKVIVAVMDAQRIGRLLRTIRHNRRWRQEDVSARAGVSQDIVSRAERGHLDGLPLRHLDAIARALDAELVVTIRWRGGDLDRLLDEGHASLVGRCAEELTTRGWDVRPEVTYSIWGERGAIDLLAFHEPTRTLLVVEVKTELASIEETLRRHDAKARLADQIARDQLAWMPGTVARLLVLPDGATPRRRVERHNGVLNRSYPLRGGDVRRWLWAPSASMSGLIFVSLPHEMRGRRSPRARKRIRGSSASAAGPIEPLNREQPQPSTHPVRR